MMWKEPTLSGYKYKKGFIFFPTKMGRITKWMEYAYWTEYVLKGYRRNCWRFGEYITKKEYENGIKEKETTTKYMDRYIEKLKKRGSLLL